MTNKPERAWRQYYALHALLHQGRCSGKTLQIVAGNVVNFFMVARPMLSSLSHIWRRAAELGDSVGPLGARVQEELRLAAGLTLVAEGKWHRPAAPKAFLSDSSQLGYALMESPLPAAATMDMAQWTERWRFQEVCRVTLRGPAPTAGRAAALEDLAPNFDAWVDSQMEVQAARRELSSRKAVARARTDYEEDPNFVPPLPPGVLSESQWKVVLAGSWRHPAAIHSKECRTSLLGLKRASRQQQYHGTTVLSI